MATPPEWKALVGAYEDKLVETSKEAIKPVMERIKLLMEKLSIRFGAFTVETDVMGGSLFHSEATCAYVYGDNEDTDYTEPLRDMLDTWDPKSKYRPKLMDQEHEQLLLELRYLLRFLNEDQYCDKPHIGI